MKIEFVYWPGNTEIQLVDDDGAVEDRIYTGDKEIKITQYLPDDRVDMELLFYFLEGVLAPPIIGGDWAPHHPYWAEREAKKKRRQENG